MKNEKGSALLTVMLMILIFTILGVTLLSISISGAKRTEIRKSEVEDNTVALTNLKEGVARIENFVALNKNLSSISINEYNVLITNFLDSVNDKNLSYDISNISSSDEFKDKIGTSQTRVLQVKSGSYSQNVFITAMPSFLKYALGSRETLTLNGSIAIDGDIYAKDQLNISNYANYIYKSKKFSQKTELPLFINLKKDDKDRGIPKIGKISLETNKANYCANETSCYNTDDLNMEINNWQPITNFQEVFSAGTPVSFVDPIQYVDVNLYETFIDKLGVNGFIKGDFDSVTNREMMQAKMTEASSNVIGLKNITSFKDIHDDKSKAETYYYEGEDAYIDTNDLSLSQNDWLIINGNAIFENSGNDKMNVNANILITGNVTIKGEVSFQSVMYSLGESTILNNVNITNSDSKNDSTFILLTDGKLEIARINKFSDWSKDTNIINGFIYTTKSAEVYGVGSLINVNGGIFSNNDLTVNGFRGDAQAGESELQLTVKDSNDLLASRLKVKNDKKLFLDQLDALPKVDQLEVIPDRIEKVK
ncbi:hypothetical protein [Bacillus massiliigorillae]|uniref:hypothetical protein n=1 Tax=Bacillus massiliigorillae TaxID=1243664 RepID=UPI00039EC0BB|nr:hypothetical protein [Bacillus massiliigorillae]